MCILELADTVSASAEEWNAIAEEGPEFAYQEQIAEPQEVKPSVEAMASVEQGKQESEVPLP